MSPRLKHDRRRRRHTGWLDGDRELLLRGTTFRQTSCSQPALGFVLSMLTRADHELMRQAWAELRDELLPGWITDHPGTRPEGWWQWDAPEPLRRVVAGYDVSADTQAPRWVRQRRPSCGVIRIYGPQAHIDGVVVESEAAYLDRHGLLSDGERAALGAFDQIEILWPASAGRSLSHV